MKHDFKCRCCGAYCHINNQHWHKQGENAGFVPFDLLSIDRNRAKMIYYEP